MYTNHLWRIILIVLLIGSLGTMSSAAAAPAINNYEQSSESLKSVEGGLFEQLGRKN
jgi:hypothetical protein